MVLNIFKKSENIKFNEKSYDEKFEKRIINFENKLQNVENFGNSLYDIMRRIKRAFHSVDIMISVKDKQLKMVFANELLCRKMYGLPNICTEKIHGRFESDIINDYIELTGKWNSFVHCADFNIDKIVRNEKVEKTFLMKGLVGDEKLFLKTTIKPHIENEIFDGITTFSYLINENDFVSERKDRNLLYDKENYSVYLLG